MPINKLCLGDTIGVVSPSRPTKKIKKEIAASLYSLQKLGFTIKIAPHFYSKFYYSAGHAKDRAADINQMFKDKKVKAIFCSTGGSCSNQLLGYLDFAVIKKNPKILLGFSDLTVLLLSLYKKNSLMTFHGPTLYEFASLTKKSKKFSLDLFMAKPDYYSYPKEMEVYKPGKAKGKLIGGNLTLINSLLASTYCPDLNKAVLFWEEIGDSPATIDFKLHELKLSGKLKNISAMIIGYLSDCRDKKYPEDNRLIKGIVLEVTKDYSFPIIKVNYFGHDIKNFYPFPIGARVVLNTYLKQLKIVDKI
jgi:muramoyltetrapeptide carboxypeptidase